MRNQENVEKATFLESQDFLHHYSLLLTALYLFLKSLKIWWEFGTWHLEEKREKKRREKGREGGRKGGKKGERKEGRKENCG